MWFQTDSGCRVSSAHPASSTWRLASRGGTAKTLPRALVDSGAGLQGRSASLAPSCKFHYLCLLHSVPQPVPTTGYTTNMSVPEDYEIYIKEVNEKETGRWRVDRRNREKLSQAHVKGESAKNEAKT